MNYVDKIKKYIDRVEYVVGERKSTNDQALVYFIKIFQQEKKQNTVFFIGNGGSAGIAIHMTADYLKNGGIKTYSMFDPSVITCLGNDFGYEYIFSKQLEIVSKTGDILVAISSSGNSANILNAVEMARVKGCKVVTFSGFKEDNKLRQLGDCNIYVPSMEYGIVESIHNMILQRIIDEMAGRDESGLK